MVAGRGIAREGQDIARAAVAASHVHPPPPVVEDAAEELESCRLDLRPIHRPEARQFLVDGATDAPIIDPDRFAEPSGEALDLIDQLVGRYRRGGGVREREQASIIREKAVRPDVERLTRPPSVDQ